MKSASRCIGCWRWSWRVPVAVAVGSGGGRPHQAGVSEVIGGVVEGDDGLAGNEPLVDVGDEGVGDGVVGEDEDVEIGETGGGGVVMTWALKRFSGSWPRMVMTSL